MISFKLTAVGEEGGLPLRSERSLSMSHFISKGSKSQQPSGRSWDGLCICEFVLCEPMSAPRAVLNLHER